MTDISFLAIERFARVRVRDTLKTLCCDFLQFMWDNHLLEPRDEWHDVEGERGEVTHFRQLLGFRVRRQFWFLKRDQILYRCRACRTELIAPLGFVQAETFCAVAVTTIGKGVPEIALPQAELQRQLQITKKRNRGGWPPKE